MIKFNVCCINYAAVFTKLQSPKCKNIQIMAAGGLGVVSKRRAIEGLTLPIYFRFVMQSADELQLQRMKYVDRRIRTADLKVLKK